MRGAGSSGRQWHSVSSPGDRQAHKPTCCCWLQGWQVWYGGSVEGSPVTQLSSPVSSIASTSFARMGGATSGGVNCSGRSGRVRPEWVETMLGMYSTSGTKLSQNTGPGPYGAPNPTGLG